MSWDAAQLGQAIVQHNVAYWQNNEPIITDYEYDCMVERLRTLAPDHPALTDLGMSVSTLGNPVRHSWHVELR